MSDLDKLLGQYDAPRRPQATLSPGPEPTGRDRIFDAVYGWFGGRPENRWAADKLTTALDYGTLGMLTGAYDGGQSLAKGQGPAQLAMAMMPGAKPVGAATKVATAAAREALPAAREAVQGIRAYHGSPHDFDRFDMSKIGTGEGAQAYGHGLYFAENEGVAKSYKNALSGQRFKDGSTFDDANPAHQASAYVSGAKSKDEAIASINEDIAMSRRQMDEKHAQVLLRARRMMERGEAIPTLDPGRMYEVNIKANPDDFLDWDKPLSQQSEIAQKAVKSTLYGKPHETIAEILRAFENSQQSMGYGDAKEQIAQRLRKAGIPGIKYLDQGSRVGGEGSRNLVVLDDRLIEIMRKYGIAGLLAAAYGATPSEADAAGPQLPRD